MCAESFDCVAASNTSAALTRPSRRKSRVKRAALASVQALELRVLLSASLIKDINTTLADANPTDFATSTNLLYFTANDGIHGTQEWQTDGTAAGTKSAVSLVPGAPQAMMSDITLANGSVYFFAQGPSDGTNTGLYKSNGTVAGTTEIAADVNGGNLVVAADGELFFDGSGGLWKSDGTTAGTVLFDPIVPYKGTGPNSLFTAGNTLYFQELPQELFASDGTAAGTTMVYAGAPVTAMASLNGKLYFSDEGTLYSSDGTSAGTQPVPGIATRVGNLFSDNGVLYLTEGSSPNVSLWKTDGTAAGTVEVSTAPNQGIGPFAEANGILYFYGTDATHGTELWRSDGTAAGTHLVADINPGPASSTVSNTPGFFSAPTNIIGFNGKVYFDANDGVHGTEIWQSDGTVAGTSQLLQINSTMLGSGIKDQLYERPVAIGQITYFIANDGVHGQQLWQTDGTTAGTSLATDIPPAANYSSIIIGSLFDYNGALLLVADNGAANNLYEIARPGAAPTLISPNTDPADYTVVGSEVYFLAYTSGGYELMASDGTASGTQEITSVSPGNGVTSMANLNGMLYFTTFSSLSQMSLWKTDGTSAGTTEVMSFAGQTNNPDLTVLGGSLYFEADDNTHGPALWKTDGTAAGTSMLWASGSATAVPTDLYAYDGNLYFTTHNPTGFANGVGGVYKSNGTAAGTILLANYTDVEDFTAALGKLYFLASPAGGYTTYCVTDGTATGTQPIDPFLVAAAVPIPMMQVNGLLFLTGYASGPATYQLWQTDGTTTQLADPTETSSGWTVDSLLGRSGDTLLFAATDAAHGSQLWGLPVAAQSSSANFAGQDTSTGGNWTGKYGSDGLDVIGGGESLPSYVTLETSGASYYQWAAVGQADGRAPLVGPGSLLHEAATEYSSSNFSVNLDFNDGQAHQVAFYLLDYDGQGRAETVQISDGDNGQLLDSRTVTNFAGGGYLVYTLGGNVTINFINASWSNAVLSGIFFGPSHSTPSVSASFAGVDAATEGQWGFTYGSQGYDILGTPSASIPSYLDFSVTGSPQFYQWATSTTDHRDLQATRGSGNLVAACAYSYTTPFGFNLDFLDGQTHQVALYLLDWDYLNRNETITVSNAATGQVLDTENVTNFSQGKYLRWDVSGDVQITVTNTGGLNAVVSGLFIDPLTSATFVKTDSTTRGTYTGVYGSQGYDVINSAAKLPSYVGMSGFSATPFTWAASTTAANALQDSPGSAGRIAACVYSQSPSFSFDLGLTDGNTHQVALYVLDWDSLKRDETIQISDAHSGKLLDSENVSNFTSGKYLVWNLSGDVNITVVNAGGWNEVLSGVFIG